MWHGSYQKCCFTFNFFLVTMHFDSALRFVINLYLLLISGQYNYSHQTVCKPPTVLSSNILVFWALLFLLLLEGMFFKSVKIQLCLYYHFYCCFLLFVHLLWWFGPSGTFKFLVPECSRKCLNMEELLLTGYEL